MLTMQKKEKMGSARQAKRHLMMWHARTRAEMQWVYDQQVADEDAGVPCLPRCVTRWAAGCGLAQRPLARLGRGGVATAVYIYGACSLRRV